MRNFILILVLSLFTFATAHAETLPDCQEVHSQETKKLASEGWYPTGQANAPFLLLAMKNGDGREGVYFVASSPFLEILLEKLQSNPEAQIVKQLKCSVQGVPHGLVIAVEKRKSI